MPQAVEVVGKAERQRLADLRDQAASGCARREFAFDGRENAFDLGALPIRFFRKGAEHLMPMAPFGTPRRLAGMMLFAHKPCQRCTWLASESNSASASTIPRERRVPPHRAAPAECARRTPALNGLAAPTKSGAAHPPQYLVLHIHHNQPLQPRTTRPGPVRMLLQASEEEGADGSVGEPRAVDGGRNGPAPASPPPTHGFLQSAIDGVVLQPPQKTIQRGVIRHRGQLQRGA
jgi:hypothetical protein